jgi:hypothetical protein
MGPSLWYYVQAFRSLLFFSPDRSGKSSSRYITAERYVRVLKGFINFGFDINGVKMEEIPPHWNVNWSIWKEDLCSLVSGDHQLPVD